jgi:hypothetical protein
LPLEMLRISRGWDVAVGWRRPSQSVSVQRGQATLLA